MDCTYCSATVDCRYDWNCPGCRARMLATLPSRELRMGWIRRWRDQGEHMMVNAVVDRLRMMDACQR